jgi:PilZ domain
MDEARKNTSLPVAIERRKFERAPLRLSLQFIRASHPEEVIDCFTENLCGEGVYFVSCHSVTIGERLEIDLRFPHNSGRHHVSLHLRCQAQVLRVDPASQGLGFGIACQIENYKILFGDADLRRNHMFQSAKA